ncbi:MULTISPECIES: DUF982 domain-containing protein [Chelativorans]|jgi:hypothetical protein|uniref:DUF982 domain-containing protein n=1 Tax=Chelativorans TaxID=449972 RepID=UPI0002F73CA8
MVVGGWKPAVSVHAGRHGGRNYVITDAAKAADVLLHDWPDNAPRGRKHLKARKVLLRCLEGKCDPGQARQAFVEAAEEANILA